jgi:CRISPR system Cascade subunit CasB
VENKQKAARDFVNAKIGYLLNSGREADVRASLAKLRRGVGKPPGSLPDIWEYTVGNLTDVSKYNPEEPTFSEWAAHMAMTLFAAHQQGNDPQKDPMSVSDRKYHLGSAVRELVRILMAESGKTGEDAEKEAEKSIKRRFDAVVTSDSPEELYHHLRGLVQLLKGKNIPLDYPQLADDLQNFQNPERRDGVRLRWGRGYYHYNRKEGEDNDR